MKRLHDLIDLLQARSDEKRDQTAYTFLQDEGAGEVQLTYAELDARARDIGARLQQEGAAGQRVLLLYPPGLDYVAGFFGCLYAGAVAVPVYPPRPDRPLQRFLSILGNAEPEFVLSTDWVASMAKGLLDEHRPMRWLATDTLDGTQAGHWKRPDVDADALAFLQYTSGSTADPKGVMVSHGNLLDNQTLIQKSFGTDSTSKVIGWLPLYHDMGLIGNVLHPLYLGTSCTLLSPLEFLREPLRWLKAIHDHQGTVSGGPNFAYDLCVRKVKPAEREQLDLSRWQVAFNGAEPIRSETIERFCDAFAASGFRKQSFVPCYGLAEATLLVTGGKPEQLAHTFRAPDLEQRRAVECRREDAVARPLVTSGRAQFVSIVDAEARALLPDGRIGEIWVANDSVAGGYFRNPAATEATFAARLDSGQGPFLRTGDLGFVQAGELFVVGRSKDLIIIRGRNHYPQDIELTAEKAHPALRPGCGAAFAHEVAGEERLVIVHEVLSAEGAPADEAIAAIRQAVALEHEVQTHAVVLIAPRSIPKTSSGKIQRRACKAAWLAGELEVVSAQEQPAREPKPEAAPAQLDGDALWLAAVVAAQLGLEAGKLDLDAPVSRLGLDSLQIVEIAHEVETARGAKLPIEAFFGAGTLRTLARLADTTQSVSIQTQSGNAVEPAGDLPLSEGQRALWFLSQLEPQSAAYNVPAAVRVHGRLDVSALRRAFDDLAARHSILRSTFPIAAGEPVRRATEGRVPFFVEEIAPAALAHRLAEEARRPFRLEAELPIRVHVFRAGEDHALLLTLHHLATDFWSQGLLLRELAVLYAAAVSGRPARLPPVAATFQDFVAHEAARLRGPEGEASLAYWLKELAGPLPVLELPGSTRPAVQSSRGAAEGVVLDAALTEGVKRLAREQQATPFMVLLAAFQTLLHRYTGDEDLVVGTAAAGRTGAAFAEVPGYFVNALALRSRPRGDKTFEAFLAETKRTVLSAFEHQELPFSRLVERLRPARDPGRSPIFQAMFVLQRAAGPDAGELVGFAMNAEGAKLGWAGLTLEALPLQQGLAQFDLTLTMGEVAGRLRACFDYCTDLFDPAFIRSFAGHFQTLLHSIVAQPRASLASLPLLAQVDRAALQAWNQSDQAYPPVATIHQWIEGRAAQSPEAVALLSGSEALTFAGLDARANQVANLLVREGAGPEVQVGLCLPRGIDLVVAMLGILKSGAAFLSLDPDAPPERTAAMLRDARAPLWIAEEGRAGVHGVRKLTMAAAGDLPRTAVPARALPQNVACAIFTSGSTGLPKGTQIEHRSLVNLAASFLECYLPTAADRILPVTSVASISFVGEVLPLLCAGGAVVIPSREEMLDERRLEALIASAGVTILSTLPSRIASLRNASQSLAKVRLLLSGGESLSAADLPQLSPELELVNGYGLTETTACSSWHPVRREDLATGRPLPIGKAIRNTRLHVLGKHLEVVPVGCEGELYVAGDGLARGYLGRPDLTADRFIPDPFREGERLYRTGDRVRRRPDGELEFVGRLDKQVKIRGHRIEVEEVEAVLRGHPGVQEAAVVARGDGVESRQLVAYVVAPAGVKASAGALLTLLREKLPEHMVPSAFVTLEALPRLPNGKLDVAALPAPQAKRPELASRFVAPRGELERQIAAVWREALKVEQVGLDDNFFDFGGHSLLLAKVHAQLREALRRDLTLVDLFRFPTVGSLAAHLTQEAAPAAKALPARKARGVDEGVAIIGMAGRFPGAPDHHQLWKNLQSGIESITFFTAAELLAAGVDPELVANPHYVRANGILGDVDKFDAGFFSLSPREADLMDPQHRVFLECSWEAMESAGYDSTRYPGRVGVFGGSSMNTYMIMNLLSHLKLVASVDTLQASLGNDKDPLTSRVSYKLDLRGPSITIQSASSTSLVAVHVACEAILAGQCEMALAGGVSIHLPETSGYMYHEGGTTAIDGHCRAFDADATGFVSGKGAGVVLLKRLSQALADGDQIHAVIRGTACNNDGALKVSYTAPSVEGQVDVYQRAMAAASVQPSDIGYIECHGTGTALGDPIEVAALTQAFGGASLPRGSVALGSLKTNIGHLDTAAGVCGLIKAAMSVEHGQLVPTLHFKTPNPEIDFAASPFEVNTALRDWPRSPRIAGVTSLGMGGTNAHVILGEAPARAPSGPSREHQLLVLSAKTATALEALCRRLADKLEADPLLPLADVAFVLQAGRRAFKHRRTLVCSTREEAIESLRAEGPTRTAETNAPAVAFLFTGQGSQYVEMGLGLYRAEPIFRAEVDRACELLRPKLGLDLREKLYPPEGHSREEASRQLLQTSITQPALFVVEHALARLLMSWGVTPQAMLGHSVGELVAAHLAGVFSLEDALELVATRGRLMQAMPPGSMLSVSLPAAQVEPLLGAELCIAAVNQADACVVSGPTAAIGGLQTRLTGLGVAARPLQTSHAFHSSMMDAALAPLADCVRGLSLSAPAIPFLSNLTGTWITDEQATDPKYWADQLRSPVKFADGAAALLQDPSRVCVEIGPGQTLAGFVRLHPSRKPAQEVASLIRHPKVQEDDQRILLNGLGKLWSAVVRIDAAAFFAGEARRRVELPTYPFERKRHWIEPKPLAAGEQAAADVRQKPADFTYAPAWQEAPQPAAEGFAARQSIWVAADGGPLSNALTGELRARGHEVIALRQAKSFARLGPEQLELDETSSVQWAQLFAAVPPPAQIVYVASRASLDRSFFGPLALLQACGARPGQPPFELSLVTTGLWDVTGAEALQPLGAAALGLGRVAPLEYPAIRCRSIDALDAAASAQGVASELFRRDAPAEVALRGKRRWVPAWQKVALPVSTLAGGLRDRGVYLITGGLGGVGLSIADELAKSCRARLVLLGRSAVRNAPVAALEASGAEVEVFAGDVSRVEDVRAAIRLAHERFGGLHGVVHAAGAPGGGLIQLRTREAAEAVFAGKLRGAFALDAALGEAEVDFVALCSSLTAVVAMPGQADYVGANAALDALAQAKAREGRRWLSINWDAWREVGMAARLDAPAEVLAFRGDLLRDGLSTAEAVQVFRAALDSGLAQVVVSTHPLSARLAARRAIGAAEEKKGDVRAAAAKAPLSQDELEQQIASVWKELLGVDQVGLHDNFFELGGTSLVGIKIIGELRSALGVEISEAGLFQAPTVSTLAKLIRVARGPEAGAAAGADNGADEPAADPAAEEAKARGQRRRERRTRGTHG